MSTTDDLIASLCAAGRVESRGDFSLDRAKAREKLRSFQVAEPHRYVQNLVALAVLRGATAIAFDSDTDDLRARFDGEPLTALDFEDLYSSSVAAASSDVDRARQQLAVGLNAALALNPRHARVTSGAPGERVRLVARHGAEDVIEGVAGAGTGTEIHVKRRFRPGLVVRFLRHVRKGMPEALALLERCVYAPIAVTINGAPMPCGLALHEEGVLHALRGADPEGRACVAGLRADAGRAPELRLVRHGVWISTLSPTHWPGGAFAVLRDDGLLTDLSGAEVVRGERLDHGLRLADAVIEAATLAWLAEAASRGVDEELRRRVTPMLLRWPAVREVMSPLGRAVGALPWWTTIFGEPATLADLRDDLKRTGAVGFTTKVVEGKLSAFPTRVVALPQRGLEPHPDLLLLREIFGDKLRDRLRELECAARREANHRRWMSRPAETTLAADRHSALARAEATVYAARLTVLVGLQRARGPSTLRTIAQGHLLAEQTIDLPLPVDLVIAGVRPNLDFDGPAADQTLATALIVAFDAALGLVEEDLARRPAEDPSDERRDRVIAFLDLRYDPAGWHGWLGRFALQHTVAGIETWLAKHGAEVPRICRAPIEVPLSRVREPWLSECARVPTLSGRALSLGAIAVAIERGAEVRWTSRWGRVMPWLDRIVLWVDDADRRLIRRVFGERVRGLDDAARAAIEAEDRFMARPEQPPPRAPASCAASLRVEEEGRIAVLWVMPERDAGPLRATMRVVVRGRVVCERSIWMPFPGIEVVLHDDRLVLTPDFGGIADDESWHGAREFVQRAAPRLAAALAEAVRARAASARTLLPVLTASFPTVGMRRAWERLVKSEGPHTVSMTYDYLLGLAVHADLAALEKAIDAALRRPMVKRGKRRVEAIAELTAVAAEANTELDTRTGHFVGEIVREIRRTCGQIQGTGTLSEQVVRASEDLLKRVFLGCTDGSTTSLLALRERVLGGGKIQVAEAGAGAGPAIAWNELGWLLRFFGFDAIDVSQDPESEATLAAPVWSPAELRPADVLVEVPVAAEEVRGLLWLPRHVEDVGCRVALFDEDGERLRTVTLFASIPLAGALCGAGLRPRGATIEMTKAAKRALHEAATELYGRLIALEGPGARAVRRDLHTRIGEMVVPRSFSPTRAQLAARVVQETDPSTESQVRTVLGEIFDELEAETRAKQPPPPPPAAPAAKSSIVPPVAALPPPTTLLLAAIRDELRALREHHDNLLSNFNLEHLRLAGLGKRADAVVIGTDAVTLNADHPLVVRAAESFVADRPWVDFLASLVFTAFNVWREDISDADEQDFHALHLKRARQRR